jgi:hypothetical protein
MLSRSVAHDLDLPAPPEHRKIVPRGLLGFRSNEPPLVSCRQVIADMIQFRPRPATSTARGTNRNPGSAFLGRASVRAGVPQCLNLKYQVDRLNPQFCILGPKASELLLNAWIGNSLIRRRGTAAKSFGSSPLARELQDVLRAGSGRTARHSEPLDAS